MGRSFFLPEELQGYLQASCTPADGILEELARETANLGSISQM
jgi:hypothetical protein